MPIRFLICLTLLLSAPASAAAAAASAEPPPTVAFWYGANPPWAELQAFDMVVVEPGHVPTPNEVAPPHTTLAAYVAVGEVQPGRAYAQRMNPAWFKGENSDWGSRLVDQSAADWPEFFTREVITPLWQAGYRAFFLDTLDSYHRFAKTPEERAAQEAGMVRLIETFKQRYPEARLIFNRGFEILERTHRHVWAVAAESLYQGYDAGRKIYRPVPDADRAWLLGQLNTAHTRFGLPVISIDYVPPGQRALARETARQIAAHGFIPWVATPDLASLGTSTLEVMPRRVLIVHSPLENEYSLMISPAVKLLTMPLNYLGYRVDYADSRHLPAEALAQRYAGVVVWLDSAPKGNELAALASWLQQQSGQQLPVAVLNDLSIFDDPALALRWGIKAGPDARSGPTTIKTQSPMLGFERTPRPLQDSFSGRTLTGGQPLLTVARNGVEQVAAAITPWGGFVQAPYAVATLATGQDERWVIDPFAFLTAALRLPPMPVPDVTTESGRRLLLVHMDGDGFASRAEFAGNPLASEVIRDQIVRRYPLPMTISIIEAELSSDGKARKMSDGPLRPLERIAQDIFREPHVEIASHSFTHPFSWQKVALDNSEGNYSLTVPGYRFDLAREIDGSVAYIENRLAPTGKKVSLFLWTGDCNPSIDAIARTQRLGLNSMNGGDTLITRSNPTLTAVAPLGMSRDGHYQVFAPNQNENVYTRNWTGPFNGFERVIETFEMTETPRRLKPINIYFHTYIGTKRASLQSLERVFDYALRQETQPIFASDYVNKVRNFGDVSIVRSAHGWIIRGAGALRTVRLPRSAGFPDLRASTGIAGYRSQGDVTYVHLAGDDATLRLTDQPVTGPNLVSSNGRIVSFSRTGSRWRWQLRAHAPLEFTLQHTEACTLTVAGRRVTPTRREGALSHYRLTQHAAEPLEANCR